MAMLNETIKTYLDTRSNIKYQLVRDRDSYTLQIKTDDDYGWSICRSYDTEDEAIAGWDDYFGDSND